jgi:hypothetical protein
LQQTCCGPRQKDKPKDGKNGTTKNNVESDQHLDTTNQSLLSNNKKSNSKLDKLDNTVINMIEQPGNDSKDNKDDKDNV